jgi:hypothetical protein
VLRQGMCGAVQGLLDWKVLGSCMEGLGFGPRVEVQLEMGTQGGLLPAQYTTQDRLLLQVRHPACRSYQHARCTGGAVLIARHALGSSPWYPCMTSWPISCMFVAPSTRCLWVDPCCVTARRCLLLRQGSRTL